MSLSQRTIIDQIEVTHSGPIQIRFAKQIVDGDTVLASEWHRTSIDPGGDLATQMAAVNSHLEQMGRLPVSDKDSLLGLLPQIVALVHTPEVVTAWQKKQAAETQASAFTS